MLKIPFEMEVPSGYKLLTLFTKFTLFTLFELLTLLTLLPSITDTVLIVLEQKTIMPIQYTYDMAK